jgi:predicted HicB family RNase H-like nuclease
MISHKGYIAKIEFDEDDKVLHGRILGIRDVITFEADSVEGAIAAFEESVDDYLAFCEERNKEPEKPFSGKFNLRIDPDLHRGISLLAAANDMSMNSWAIEAIIKAFLEGVESRGEEMRSILLPEDMETRIKIQA